jgi:H+/gluconate symporter-like permease
MGLPGILLALGLLIWLAYRGWSVLLLAPAAALVAAAIAREPLLAHWTQTFMGSAAQFLAQFFPLFLLGALFGKLMDDSGSVEAIARFMTERLRRDHCRCRGDRVGIGIRLLLRPRATTELLTC